MVAYLFLSLLFPIISLGSELSVYAQIFEVGELCHFWKCCSVLVFWISSVILNLFLLWPSLGLRSGESYVRLNLLEGEAEIRI